MCTWRKPTSDSNRSRRCCRSFGFEFLVDDLASFHDFLQHFAAFFFLFLGHKGREHCWFQIVVCHSTGSILYIVHAVKFTLFQKSCYIPNFGTLIYKRLLELACEPAWLAIFVNQPQSMTPFSSQSVSSIETLCEFSWRYTSMSIEMRQRIATTSNRVSG